nr:hypothetical protein [Candidatus Sigynarchaeota archaeon]
MKKTTPILCFLFTLFMFMLIPATCTDTPGYLGFKQGDTYTFTYLVIPSNETPRVPKSVDLPFTIVNIMEINNTECNVTYETRYKILVDTIPQDVVNQTSVIINNVSMNLFNYVNSSSSPWGIFFTNKTNGQALYAKNLTLYPANNSRLGNGTLSWDYRGILSYALLTTRINETESMVMITLKAPGAVPGFPTPVIFGVLIGTVVIVVTLTTRKIRKKSSISR